MKCKQKQKIDKPEEITMKNGRKAIKGICSKCGTKIFAIQKGGGAVSKKSSKKRKSKSSSKRRSTRSSKSKSKIGGKKKSKKSKTRRH